MASRRTRRPYPIEWVNSFWERKLWCAAQTFHPIVELIERTAHKHGRSAYIDEPTELPANDLRMAYSVDTSGKFSLNVLKQERRAVVMALAIQRVVRNLIREEGVRIIRQADLPSAIDSPRRMIEVSWRQQPRSVIDQLKALQRAVLSRSQYDFEKAWFALIPRAHEYLSVGWHVARQRSALKQYNGPLETTASIIPLAVPTRELLRIILPFAIRAAALPGRRPEHPRDEALAAVLQIVVEITNIPTGSIRRGDYDEPCGRGAEFVHEIEKIFGLHLMPPGSTHAVARAKKRLRRAAD